VLANGSKFDQPGTLGAIGADFDSRTATVSFRADFPNPDRLLRHGQTGRVVFSRVLSGVIAIPQRATFEVLARRYAYVVDKDGVAHQREIQYDAEAEDVFIVKQGLNVGDKIVVDGIRQVHDGEKVE
jgi:membrane fusion protein, multidrug efflux system